MADFLNKYLNSDGVRYLWNKANNIFLKKESGKGLSTNDYTNEEKEKLESLENYELPKASNEVLGGIKLGDGLSVDENGIVSTVYNPEMDVDFTDIINTPTTVEGYGITDAVTTDNDIFNDVDNIKNNISHMDQDIGSIQEHISSMQSDIEEIRVSANKAIHYVGQVETVADLEAIENPNDGDMYDVKEDGANYAWSSKDSRWDNLGAKFEIESLSDYDIDVITGCATSEETLKAILAEGGDVELATNIALTEPVSITEDTVLDLNGFELSGNVSGYIFTANNAKLTLKNGNITVQKRIAQAENGGEIVVESGNFTSNDVGFSALGEGSKVTINGGTIHAVEGGAGAFDNGSIEFNDGNIECSDNFGLFTNGSNGRGNNTIVMNGGEIIGNIASNGYEACGVYIANNDSFTMNGGHIVGHGGAGLLMRAGTVVINDGEIISEVSANRPAGSTGWIGDKKTQMTQSAVIYDEAANYPGKASMSLTINGGKFIGVAHSVEILSNEAEPAVTITGGKFTPAYPEV